MSPSSDMTTTTMTDDDITNESINNRPDLDAEHVVHLDDNEIHNINGMDERYNM